MADDLRSPRSLRNPIIGHGKDFFNFFETIVYSFLSPWKADRPGWKGIVRFSKFRVVVTVVQMREGERRREEESGG
jgi:hypothetical protein